MSTQKFSDEFQKEVSALKSGQKKQLIKKVKKIKENICDENEIEEMEMNRKGMRKVIEGQRTAPLMNLRIENINNEFMKGESKIRKLL